MYECKGINGANRTAHRLTNIDAGGSRGRKMSPMILQGSLRPFREREMKCECRAVSFQRASDRHRRRPNRIPKRTFSYLILTAKARPVRDVRGVRRWVPFARKKESTTSQTLRKTVNEYTQGVLKLRFNLQIFDLVLDCCCVSRSGFATARAR